MGTVENGCRLERANWWVLSCGGVSCKMSMTSQHMGSGEKEEKSRNHSQALLKPSDLATRPTSAFAYKNEWRGIYTPGILE